MVLELEGTECGLKSTTWFSIVREQEELSPSRSPATSSPDAEEGAILCQKGGGSSVTRVPSTILSPCRVLKLNFITCVCVFSSHSFWTSSSLDVPAGVTQEEGHTGFLIHLLSAVRALIFVARRIQPFLSLVDREVEFCVLTN